MVMSLPIWVLGNELWSSARVTHAHNCSAVSLVIKCYIIIFFVVTGTELKTLCMPHKHSTTRDTNDVSLHKSDFCVSVCAPAYP